MPRTHRPGSDRRARFRPNLLMLEGRDAPAVLTVTSLADSGPDSLRTDIAAANAGDTIRFDPFLAGGTITLTSGELLIGKTLTIEGLGAGRLTVSGNDSSRVFDVTVLGNLTLSDLTVSHGMVGSSENGGGLYSGGGLSLSRCLFAHNVAGFDGGGVSTYGTSTITNCTFWDNQASGGAGASLYGTTTLTDCTLIGNQSSFSAGGLLIGGTLTGSGCTFSGNSASFVAGGVYVYGNGTLTNCTVANNTADFTDGGVYVAGSLTMTSCTVTDNGVTSGTFGVGGLYVATNDMATLHNTLVAGNTGGGSSSDGYGVVSGSSSYSLVGDGTNMTGISDGVNGNRVGTRFSPINARLGSLQDNGGPTTTVALLPDSPALGTGDPALTGTPDQRGVVRGSPVSIGAYQATAAYFDLSAPASVTAGAPFAVTVTIRDAYGNVVPGYTGVVYLNSTDPQNPYMDGHVFTASDGGTFTFTGEQLFTAPEQLLYAVAADLGSTGPVVAVVPAAPAYLYLVVPDSAYGGVSAGSPVTVTAVLYDAYGNLATNYAGTVHFTSTDSATTPPDDYTFTAGDAGSHAFSVTFVTPGTVTLTARDATAGLVGSIDLFVV